MSEIKSLTDEQKKQVIENAYLVEQTIQKNHYFMRNKSDSEDLIEAGYEGLIYATKHYDKNKSQFKTFAINCIKKYLSRYIILTIQNGYITEKKSRQVLKCYKLENMGLTDPEIIEKMNITPDELKTLKLLSKGILSIDKNTSNDAPTEVTNLNIKKPEFEFEINLKYFIQNTNLLDDREKEVVLMHLGFYKKIYNFEQIGQKYQISHQCAVQIYQRAIKKLQNHFTYESKKQIEETDKPTKKSK